MVKELESSLEGPVTILADSQAALKALMSWTINSKAILDCKNALLEVRDIAGICWVLGHSDIAANEEADELARGGSHSTHLPCYAPTEPKDDDSKDLFCSQLDSAISSLPKGDIKPIIGDFNDTVGYNNSNLSTVMGTQGLGNVRNDNGDRLVDFCVRNRLFIGGSKFAHKNIRKYTWESPDGQTRNLRPAVINRQHQKRNKLNLLRLQSAETARRYKVGLTGKLRGNNMINTWDDIATTCREVATSVIGTAQQPVKTMDQAKTNEAKVLGKSNYRVAANIVKRLARRDKRLYFNKLAEQAEQASNIGNIRSVYETIKQTSGNNIRPIAAIKGENGRELSSPEEQIDRWRKFFSHRGASR
ncbi:uncharacterized protein [Musca autumnalis]|uniref:uncharacterized protein n=1 Tax=Musca autumnalis TaxID=221902 RepID=UPI003CEFB0E8